MAADWYYKTIKNKEVGPFTSAAFKNLASGGHICFTTMVRKGTDGRWVSATKVKGLLSGEAPIPKNSTPMNGFTPPLHSDEPEAMNPGWDSHPVSHRPSEARPITRAEHYDSPPGKSFSLALQIGAGAGLLVAIVMIFLVFSVSGKPDKAATAEKKSSPNLVFKPLEPSPADLEREQQARLLAEKRKAMEEEEKKNVLAMEEEKKKTQTFDDAKKILLTAIDTVGGSPEGNIKKGIELLSITLSHPDTVNHAEAKILLEHARIAISDEMAIQFMKTLDDYRRRTISGDDASRDEMIIVRQSQLEALSQGFSTRFKSKVDKGQEEPNIFVCSQYWEGGGKFHNSIETGFYTTLKKNVKRAIEQVAVEGQKQEEKRKAAREESPKLTALIFDIEERPEAFAGRCVYFDDFGMYGKTDKKSDIDYRLQVTDSRGKFYTSVGFAEKEIVFSTSRTVAAQIQALTQDGNKYKVKLYCDMYVSTRNGPWAKVYKIDFYNKGGGIAFTVKD